MTLFIIFNEDDDRDVGELLDEWIAGIDDATYEKAITAALLFTTLGCDENGDSLYSFVAKPFDPDETEGALDKYGTLNTYQKLYDELETLTKDKSEYYGDEVTIFTYDWRMSAADSAAKLNTFINQNGYDNVVLVAHSFGGLVASGYMAIGATQRSKVKSVYFLGSPLLGCGEVVNAWYNTDISALNDSDINNWIPTLNTLLGIVTLESDPIRKLISNYQSIYELLPTEQYFTLAGQYYLTRKRVGIYWGGGSTETENCTTYATTMNYVSDLLQHFDDDLMSNAKAFHDSLYRTNGWHISSYCKAYYIYGANLDTRTNYIYGSVTDGTSYNETLEVVDETDNMMGDTLVPKWSVALGGASMYQDRIYRCEGVRHMGIISNVEVCNFIKQSILGSDDCDSFSKVKEGYR